MSFNMKGAAAGAAAGSAAGPWGAAIGGVVGGFSGGGGGAGNSAPSNASNMGQVEGPKLDSSGWNISFGNNSGITTDRTETVAGQFSEYLPYVVVIGAILIGWRYLKK